MITIEKKKESDDVTLVLYTSYDMYSICIYCYVCIYICV